MKITASLNEVLSQTFVTKNIINITKDFFKKYNSNNFFLFDENKNKFLTNDGKYSDFVMFNSLSGMIDKNMTVLALVTDELVKSYKKENIKVMSFDEVLEYSISPMWKVYLDDSYIVGNA